MLDAVPCVTFAASVAQFFSMSAEMILLLFVVVAAAFIICCCCFCAALVQPSCALSSIHSSSIPSCVRFYPFLIFHKIIVRWIYKKCFSMPSLSFLSFLSFTSLLPLAITKYQRMSEPLCEVLPIIHNSSHSMLVFRLDSFVRAYTDIYCSIFDYTDFTPIMTDNRSLCPYRERKLSEAKTRKIIIPSCELNEMRLK